MLGEESLSQSGFLARLLVCHTRATPRRIEGNTDAISSQITDRWSQLIQALFETFHEARQASIIEADAGAHSTLVAYHNEIVDRREDDLSDVGSFAARYAENAWRLTLVLHATLHGANAATRAVERETAENGVRLMKWFVTSQLEVLSKRRAEVRQNLQEEVLKLADRLGRGGEAQLTARAVYRARIVPSPDESKALLDRMVDEGILDRREVTPVRGGKTTSLYTLRIDPLLN